MKYQNIFLLIGSNLGGRLSNLNRCVDLISTELGSIIKPSSVYETAPWGKSDQPNYLNQAIQIETNFGPAELLGRCLTLEKQLGRERKEKWGARVIDVDLIYFNDRIINSKDLVIPHPRMTERKFVLEPLTEISPNFMHPLLKKTNQELLTDCKDQLPIKRLIHES